MLPEGNANIRVEATDPLEFYCFRLTFNPHAKDGDAMPCIEIMLHARALVDLIHKASSALCDWQADTTKHILSHFEVSEDDLRRANDTHALLVQRYLRESRKSV